MNLLVALSAFLAAGVEWVEALTIVLAVGIYQGWRTALTGALAAFAVLAILTGSVAKLLDNPGALATISTIVGVALVLFGLRWLHKAILRSAGLKALHDEAAAFEEAREELATGGPAVGAINRVGFATAFAGVFLEGLEVVFIVIALGHLNGLVAAGSGALGALVVVVAVGVALRSPLTKVPENAMKFVVGVMLSSFGTFFAGEGIGVRWWHADVSILLLIAVYGGAALALTGYLRRAPATGKQPAVVRRLTSTVREFWGLFVDNPALALFAVVTVLAVALYVHGRHAHFAGVWLVLGMLIALLAGLSGSLTAHRAAQRKALLEARTITGQVVVGDLAQAERVVAEPLGAGRVADRAGGDAD